MKEAAMENLEGMEKHCSLFTTIVRGLHDQYETELKSLETKLGDLLKKQGELDQEIAAESAKIKEGNKLVKSLIKKYGVDAKNIKATTENVRADTGNRFPN
ncbi:hypothetical protein Tco_0853848 [Tanacetum coccineum]